MTPNAELLFELDRLLAELERRLGEYADALEPTVADEGLALAVRVKNRVWHAERVARRAESALLRAA